MGVVSIIVTREYEVREYDKRNLNVFWLNFRKMFLTDKILFINLIFYFFSFNFFSLIFLKNSFNFCYNVIFAVSQKVKKRGRLHFCENQIQSIFSKT